MLCFMLVELNTYGSVVSLLGGVNPTIAALIVAITTTIYTTYGGFKASLWTDNVNAIIIAIFIIIAGVAVGVNIDITRERIDASGLLSPQRMGGELWYILLIALVFSQMLNQGKLICSSCVCAHLLTPYLMQASGSALSRRRTTRPSTGPSSSLRSRSSPSASSSA